MKASALVLHPVRLRIIQAFLGGRCLTTSELREHLPDVPPATLYRQVGTLVDGELLEVAEERRVRGTFERAYRLREGAGSIGPDEAREMSDEEHRRGLVTFVAGILADFDRYLEGGDTDLARDLVGYRQVALNLSDKETTALVDDLRRAVAARAGLPEAPGRRRRSLTTILVPTSS